VKTTPSQKAKKQQIVAKSKEEKIPGLTREVLVALPERIPTPEEFSAARQISGQISKFTLPGLERTYNTPSTFVDDDWEEHMLTIKDAVLDINRGLMARRLPSGDERAGLVTLAKGLPEGAYVSFYGLPGSQGKILKEMGINPQASQLSKTELKESKELAVRIIDTRGKLISAGKNLSNPALREELTSLTDRAKELSAKSLKSNSYVGVVRNGRLVSEDPARMAKIKEAKAIRKELIAKLEADESGLTSDEFRRLRVSRLGFKDDEDAHQKLDNLENDILGRKPGKVESFDTYNERASKWSEATFGKTTQGANGFSLGQTLAHDVAHPITHELVGMETKAINKHFGGLLDKSKKPTMIPEEAIVNVMEHLSRGDTIEASILNGIRLARTLSRSGNTGRSKAAGAIREYVRSPEFVKKLSDLAHKAYKADNFAPLMGHVRKSNKISKTVTVAGDNFDNSATGG
jgi:hypothetical protein